MASAVVVGFAALSGSLLLAGAEPPPSVAGGAAAASNGWVLPAVSWATHLLAAATVGLLLLAGLLLPSPGPDAQGLAIDAIRLARKTAAVWALGTIAVFTTTTSEIFGAAPLDLRADQLLTVLRDSVVGRGLALQASGALILALALRWTIATRTVLGWSVFALVAMMPVALSAHPASAGSHQLASIGLCVQDAALTIWFGGTLALGWLAVRGSKRLDMATRRFSGIAVWCSVIVVVTAVLGAVLRAVDLPQLISSPYGQVSGLAVLFYVGLGIIGVARRRATVRGASITRRLAGSELLAMVAASGVAAGLARAAVPAGEVLLTPAEDLLGGVMPPAPNIERLLLATSPSGVALVVVGLGVTGYVAAVNTLQGTATPWPRQRTASWLAGMAVVAWATAGGLGLYANVLFSAHLASQVILAMVAAPLLILGAPGVLALRVLPDARQPGEDSPRDVLRAIGTSRFVSTVTQPVVSAATTVAAFSLIYLTPFFEVGMGTPLGRFALTTAALLVGLIFFLSVFGSELIARQSQRTRRIAVGLLLAASAGFAVRLHSSGHVVGRDYWIGLERPFADDLSADQSLAALCAVVVAWVSLAATAVLHVHRAPTSTRSSGPPGPAGHEKDRNDSRASPAFTGRRAGHPPVP